MSYLVLDRLTKTYGETKAVDGVSLAVERGEFVSLLGPSGCGKTTTLQIIAGFIEPSSGAVRLDGRDLLKIAPAKRGLGIVFQSYALFPHMTAAENVGFGLEMRRVPGHECKRLVEEALALVGLAGLGGRHPARLSGGQQQRVALARALVIKPSVLLLDEPLSNLDAKLREEMQLELRQIQRTVGTTTVLVTHDQAEAMALSDRVIVMSRGRVEQVASPHEAYEQPASAFVASFLGRTNTLKGRVEASDGAARLVVGSATLPAPADMPPGPVAVSVRPERIAFAPKGVPGTLATRVFQGSHWLCHVETPAGTVVVIRQNDGVPLPREGEAVHLAWNPEDGRIAPAESA